MDLHWLITGFSTVVAVVSLWVAWRALTVKRWPHSKISELELEVLEIADDQSRLRESFKKLNARVGMREAREKLKADTTEAEEELPRSASIGVHTGLERQAGESDSEWKARARQILHIRRT